MVDPAAAIIVENNVMACLREAAAAGKRCPTSGEISAWMDDRGFSWMGLGSAQAVTTRLAKRGRIRVLVFGRNFRKVEILEQPLAATADPPRPGPPWITIDRRGTIRDV